MLHELLEIPGYQPRWLEAIAPPLPAVKESYPAIHQERLSPIPGSRLRNRPHK
jgi:hypothetical protein